MITKIGAQHREPIEDTEYDVESRSAGFEVVLRDRETGKRELWTQHDCNPGYTIVIEGVWYEFVTSL